MRRAAQVDANQAEIVQALRKWGCSVQSLAAQGKGCPDLLVGLRGQNHLLEVKDGKKVPSEQQLRDSQEKWHAAWRGPPVFVVRNVEEALVAVGLKVTHG